MAADTHRPTGSRNRRWWLLWALLTLLVAGYVGVALALHERADAPLATLARLALLPGATSHGHHQIELACKACHSDPFGGGEVLQKACVGCHGKALEEAEDKHPARKFEDPRNAFRLDKINAVVCVTCHVEHRPAVTRTMGVTQAADYCAFCHAGPDEMPPSHQGFKFDGCRDCHNYHDNRALYEDFLLRHAPKPAQLEQQTMPARELLAALQQSATYPADQYPFDAVTAARADAPAAWASSGPSGARKDRPTDNPLATRHAEAGVNCSACHRVGSAAPAASAAAGGEWQRRPLSPAACAGCHGLELRGFESGLHGMRAAAGLSPMTVDQAQLPMRDEAAHRSLNCVSCHAAHRFDTGLSASVDACLGCHADRHSRAYKASRHYALAQREARGEGPPGSGVTCASCHMPRLSVDTDEGSRIAVQHNQSQTLRPNSKMVRPVCMNCHGLGFSLDALADRDLIGRNFAGLPSAPHQSIPMALRKDAETRARRAAQAASRAATAAASAGGGAPTTDPESLTRQAPPNPSPATPPTRKVP